MGSHRRKRVKHSRGRRKAVPGWLWLLGGLSLGLLVAAAVYFYEREPAAQQKVQAKIPAPESAPSKPVTANTKKAVTAKETAAAKPRFDFYAILPEMEVVVPDAEIRANARGSADAPERPSTYILQAGSFRAYEDADRLKANLALLGIESRIETVTGSNKETWHRVRTIPSQDARQVNRMRTRMLNNNINSVLLKVKE